MAPTPSGSPTASVRPTPETAAIVAASAREALAREPHLVHVVARSAGVGDPAAHPVEGRGDVATEVVHSLLVAATGQVGPDDVEAHWRFLGTNAARTRFPDDGLIRLGHALLRAVRDLNPEWSSAVSSGWLAFHLWMTTHVTEGIEAAGPTGPAEPPSAPGSAPEPAPAEPPGPDQRFELDDLMTAMESGFRRRR